MNLPVAMFKNYGTIKKCITEDELGTGGLNLKEIHTAQIK